MLKIRDRVAGLDVHRDTVVACTQVGEPGGVASDTQTFATTSAGLIGFVLDAGVSTVAMEATGVLRKPVYYALEGVVEKVCCATPRR
jgi:transposase